MISLIDGIYRYLIRNEFHALKYYHILMKKIDFPHEQSYELN